MPGLLSQASNQAAGLTRGLLYGGLGAPVDLANMALLGAGGQRPVGGSAWLEQKIDPLLSRFIGAPNSGQSAARFVGDVVAPGPGEFAAGSKALQGLLADPATATKIQQMVGGLLGMTAYHGSPHRFDQFRLADDTIGTGEGAQAYGYGLYFAEDPKVAGKYFNTFADTNVKNSQDLIDYFKPGEIRQGYGGADRILAFDPATGSVTAQAVVKDAAGNWVPDPMRPRPRVHQTMPDAKEMERVLGRKPSNASFYTVDIPDEQIGKMLDWDKPLSEQPETIKKVAENFGVSLDKEGKDLYSAVGRKYMTDDWALGGNATWQTRDVNASRILKEAGIPGIRYLDGISRKAGEGTRNFVVFDDSIIKILNRE